MEDYTEKFYHEFWLIILSYMGIFTIIRVEYPKGQEPNSSDLENLKIRLWGLLGGFIKEQKQPQMLVVSASTDKLYRYH